MTRAAILILLTASCGPTDAPEAARTSTAIECALDGASTFKPNCAVERSVMGDRAILTLFAPDGGFRRIAVDQAGWGIETADGVVPAEVEIGTGGTLSISVARDRYRLPAAAP